MLVAVVFRASGKPDGTRTSLVAGSAPSITVTPGGWLNAEGGKVDIPSGRRAGLLYGALISALAWMLSRLVVGATSVRTLNPFSTDSGIWVHWDAFNYLSIAQHGRTFGRCGSPGIPSPLPQFRTAKFCGSAGWLPGYPWLIRGAHELGLSYISAGQLIAQVGLYVALFLVWLGWCRQLELPRALPVLLLVGVFPGAVYNFALFPTSVTLALVLAAILLAAREHYLSAGLAMIAAGLCYPSAWFAAAGLAIAMVLIALPSDTEAVIRRVLWGLWSLGALPILLLLDRIQLGDASAYFVIQGYGGSDILSGFSLAVPVDVLVTENTYLQRQLRFPASALLAAQGLIAIGFATAATVISCIRTRIRDWNPVDAYPALVGAVVMLSLVFAERPGTWSRSLVIAAPCIVSLRRIPTWLLWSLAVVVAGVTMFLSRSFFTNVLV